MESQGSLWLTSFTGHSVFKVHPHYRMYKYCISLYCYIIFHCLDRPHFYYPFSLWTQVVSTFWLLWITLIWIFMYTFLCEHTFSSLLSVHLGEEFLGYMVTPRLTYHRTASLFSNVAAPFCTPVSAYESSTSPYSSQQVLFSTAILVTVKQCLVVVWFCMSLRLISFFWYSNTVATQAQLI